MKIIGGVTGALRGKIRSKTALCDSERYQFTGKDTN